VTRSTLDTGCCDSHGIERTDPVTLAAQRSRPIEPPQIASELLPALKSLPMCESVWYRFSVSAILRGNGYYMTGMSLVRIK
jgi:hypothetical protein